MQKVLPVQMPVQVPEQVPKVVPKKRERCICYCQYDVDSYSDMEEMQDDVDDAVAFGEVGVCKPSDISEVIAAAKHNKRVRAVRRRMRDSK